MSLLVEEINLHLHLATLVFVFGMVLHRNFILNLINKTSTRAVLSTMADMLYLVPTIKVVTENFEIERAQRD